MTLGKFTVRLGLRADNPAFPSYLVFVGCTLIGKQFSMPTISDCEWLERQLNADQPQYAEKSKPPRRLSTGGCRTRNATRFEPETA